MQQNAPLSRPVCCTLAALGVFFAIAVTPQVCAQGNETDNATTQPLILTAEMDPFRYNVPEGSRGFLPSRSGSVPPGIRVVGILCLQGRKPLAALTVPGYEEPVYVSEHDLIAINRYDVTGVKQKDASEKTAAAEVMYVQVGTITSGQVELFPKTNPGNVQILR